MHATNRMAFASRARVVLYAASRLFLLLTRGEKDQEGKQPYWPENLLRRHIRPAAKRCGISKPIGWHTFRHSYATHLKANGEDVKVVQESLRHANSRITLDTYTQAVTSAKRQAQTKVVNMILPKRIQTVEAGGGN
jgi:site-specific recombinase XerD